MRTRWVDAANESFVTLETAGYGELLRGVSFTPGTVAPTAPPALPVTSSGLIYSRASKGYTSTISMLNNTNSAVTGPYLVVFTNLTFGITLTNGTTTVNGSPAIRILDSGAALNPGQSASVAAIFTDPSNAGISYTPVAMQP